MPSNTVDEPVVHHVDARTAAVLTAIWAIPLALWACYAFTTFPALSLDGYRNFRNVLVAALLLISGIGVYVAWGFIGGDKTAKPWYTNGFLVAAVVFWAVAPPVWFFVEYLNFDSEKIGVPANFIKCKSTVAFECAAEVKVEYLKHVKTYSDMASKIWAATGAALGAAIAAARK
jgi:hypothetical protein